MRSFLIIFTILSMMVSLLGLVVDGINGVSLVLAIIVIVVGVIMMWTTNLFDGWKTSNINSSTSSDNDDRPYKDPQQEMWEDLEREIAEKKRQRKIDEFIDYHGREPSFFERLFL